MQSHSSSCKVFDDTLQMGLNDGIPSYIRKKEFYIILVVHHEVLREDCRHYGVSDDIKRCFKIGISIGEILADSALKEVV